MLGFPAIDELHECEIVSDDLTSNLAELLMVSCIKWELWGLVFYTGQLWGEGEEFIWN